MDHAFGALKSPVDYRDRVVASSVIPSLTPVDDLPAAHITDLGPVLNQHKTPSCVSHDVTMLIRRYFFLKTGEWIKFSPRFLDIMAKRFDGIDRETGGTYPRLVMHLAATYGCATEAALPNNTLLSTIEYRNDKLITDEVLAEAAKYKIPGYINVPTDLAGTRNAVYLYGAVSTLFEIGSELWLPSWSTKDINPLRTPKQIVSGHQMAIVGWHTDGLNRGRNQWGVEWNLNGDFLYDHQAWKPYIVEQWAVAEVSSDVRAFLNKLPAPKDFHYRWDTNMKRGDFNEDVKMVQVALMILGYLAPVKADELGHFGAKTALANYAFQNANNVHPPSPDNIGPMTRAVLNQKFAV